MTSLRSLVTEGIFIDMRAMCAVGYLRVSDPFNLPFWAGMRVLSSESEAPRTPQSSLNSSIAGYHWFDRLLGAWHG
jgi:hypothetical protein